MTALDIIKGDRCSDSRRIDISRSIEAAIRLALRRGYRIGRRVRIGAIDGEIVGYNIASYGRYVGAYYPLVVATEFGIAKCHPSELRPTRESSVGQAS